ncbi:MAG: hypothetical protein HY259_09365 [Chloroflexi bacterium]|nr:hypothetical protein [Chloroflexota bacterium]
MTSIILSQLQQVDSELDRAQQRLAEIERLRADRYELDRAQADVAEAGRAAAEGRLLRQRELELKALEGRIAELDEKLYSGRIRNAKELEGYEREARMFKQNKGKLEEDVLALMEAADQADDRLAAAQQRLAAVQAVREQAEQVWRQDGAEAQQAADDLQLRQSALRERLDGEAIALYDRLRRTRGGLAVVAARGGRCGACGIGVSSAALQNAAVETAIAQCDNCGRMLYWE